MKTFWRYFTTAEKFLWGISVCVIISAFVVWDRENYLSLVASLIGVTSLIFNAKGNPFGQFLMLVFSALYGIISYTFAYYGEMITYLGMTAPMALFALLSWLKNPYKGNRAEVAVRRIGGKETACMFLSSVIVTVGFYFLLRFFQTNYLWLSTLSVTTSFLAVYLTFRRSPYFALAYALNDMVLIALWVLATLENRTYLSVVICFCAFLINDIYGYISWRRMYRRQNL